MSQKPTGRLLKGAGIVLAREIAVEMGSGSERFMLEKTEGQEVLDL